MDFNLSFVYMYRILTVNVVCLQAERPPFVECQLCHLTFRDQSTISAHYDSVHLQPTRERRSENGTAGNHECDICGKKYVDKKYLKVPQANVHGKGEVKSFSCELCARKFKQKRCIENTFVPYSWTRRYSGF